MRGKTNEALHKTGVKVIASTHNFEKTEDMETLKRRFLDMDATGADILKMAVMPKAFEDVASLMPTTHEITEEYTEKPVILRGNRKSWLYKPDHRRKFWLQRYLCLCQGLPLHRDSSILTSFA